LGALGAWVHLMCGRVGWCIGGWVGWLVGGWVGGRAHACVCECVDVSVDAWHYGWVCGCEGERVRASVGVWVCVLCRRVSCGHSKSNSPK